MSPAGPLPPGTRGHGIVPGSAGGLAHGQASIGDHGSAVCSASAVRRFAASANASRGGSEGLRVGHHRVRRQMRLMAFGRSTGLVRSHEPEDPFGPVSRANQALALARIARSSRNRRFSRRSRRNSSRFAVVLSSLRRPSSRFAWAAQLRIDCADGSNSRASWSGPGPDPPSAAGTVPGTGSFFSTSWVPPPPRMRCPPNGVKLNRGLDLGIVGTSSSKGCSVHETGASSHFPR